MSVVVRQAATLILLKFCVSKGLQTLLLRRTDRASFMAGKWVFPGGAIDSQDFNDEPVLLDPKQNPVHSAVVQAALRETLEEAGIKAGERPISYWSHWTTPVDSPKRFSTWYLITQYPQDQNVEVDGQEIVAAQWLTPQKALELSRQNELPLSPPTFATLHELGRFNDIAALHQHARGRTPPVVLPKLVKGPCDNFLLFNGDSGFEQGRLEVPGHRYRMLIRHQQPWDVIGEPI